MTDMFLIAVASILQIFILSVNGDLPFTSKAHNDYPYPGCCIEIASPSENKTEEDVPWLPCPGRCFSDYRKDIFYEGGNPASERTFEMCNDDAGRHAWERALENCCEECAAYDDGLVVNSKKCTNYALTQIATAALGNNCRRFHCKIFNSSVTTVFKDDDRHYSGKMVDSQYDSATTFHTVISLPESSLRFDTSWEYKFAHKGDEFHVNHMILEVGTYRVFLTEDSEASQQCGSISHGCFGFHRGYRIDFGNGWYKIIIKLSHNSTDEIPLYKLMLKIAACSKDSFYAKAYFPFNKTGMNHEDEFALWFHVKAGLPALHNAWKYYSSYAIPGYRIPRSNAYHQTVVLNDDWKKPALTVSYHETDSLESSFILRYYNGSRGNVSNGNNITMYARLERNLMLWTDFDFVRGNTETTEWSTEAMDDFRIALHENIPKALYEKDFLAKLFADNTFQLALEEKRKSLDRWVNPEHWYLAVLQGEHLQAEHRVAFVKLAEDNNGFNGLPAKLEKMKTSEFNGHAQLTWNPEANAEGVNEKSVQVYEMYLYYIMPFRSAEAKALVDATKAVFRSLIFEA